MDLETLFTSPDGFDVRDAMPLQRALCRTARGLPLADLATHPHVISGYGGPEAVAALPVGEVPQELHFVGASRSGKSKLTAADIVVSSQDVNVDGTSTGDIVRISVLGLRLSTNAIWTHLVQTLLARPMLRRLVVGEIKDGLLALRHPSGQTIEVMLVPLDRWGGTLISVYSAGVYVDEEPRMIGAEDGAKNWDHAHTAALGRLLPGAKWFGVGAPFAPAGPIYDLVQNTWGKPGQDVIVVRGTGPQMNPSWWTPARCERLERTNPDAYQTDVLGEFAVQEQAALNHGSVRKNTREGPLELVPNNDGIYAGAVDVGRGRWTLAITQAYEAKRDSLEYYRIALAREVVAIDPNDAWREVARLCKHYGVTSVRVDQYAAPESNSLAERHGVHCVEHKWTEESRREAFEDLITLIHADRVDLPPDRLLRRDLLSVKKRPKQSGGFQYHLPTTNDGRHADFFPAVAASLRAARHALLSANADLSIGGATNTRGWGADRYRRGARLVYDSRGNPHIEREY